MAKPIKSEMYMLVIDRDRDKILSALMGSLLGNDSLAKAFAAWAREEGLEDAVSDFFHEKSEKGHTRGWCEDPECAWEGKVETDEKETE